MPPRGSVLQLALISTWENDKVVFPPTKSPRAQLSGFRPMFFSNVTKSQPLHRNLKVADFEI